MPRAIFWTNSSVCSLAGERDPVAVVEEIARQTLFRYLEDGGSGPPFDPFELAAHLSIETVPSNDVRDAQIAFRGNRYTIEFNPNRPKSRINYSVAHEIAHTFFPDCKSEVRKRSLHAEMHGDDWQLEMLCNIAAAELLMPATKIPELGDRGLKIEGLVDLRLKFEVSIEALLLRLIKTTKRPTIVFAASRNKLNSTYKIDYAISTSDELRLANGALLPADSVVADCTAIGFTAHGKETWNKAIGSMTVQCVGIPAFPGHPFPRVVGFASPGGSAEVAPLTPTLVRGDATKPRGEGPRVIAFIVNDATPRWGAGFALAVRRKWPDVQQEFIDWAEASPSNLRLGNVHFHKVNDELFFAEMVCQRGYGTSKKPRIRYEALEDCLRLLATGAKARNASIHMPKIGSGEARGNWSIILDLIEQLISRDRVPVTIYELVGARKSTQQPLLFSKPAAQQ